jgi:alpha-2-macroglobulin
MKIKIPQIFKTSISKLKEYSIKIIKKFRLLVKSFPVRFRKNIVCSENKFEIGFGFSNSDLIFVFPKFAARIVYAIKTLLQRISTAVSSRFLATKIGNRINQKWNTIPKFVQNTIQIVLIFLFVLSWFVFPKVKQLGQKFKDYEYNNRAELVFSTIQDGQKEVAIDEPIQIQTSKPISPQKLERHLKSRSNIDLSVQKIENKKYKIEITEGLKTDKTYTLNFSDNKLLKNRKLIQFDTIKSPSVIATNLNSIRSVDEKIIISFNPNINLFEINQENPDFLTHVITTDPPIEGYSEILTPSVLRFTPKTNYPYDKLIKVTVNNKNIINGHGLEMLSTYQQTFHIPKPDKKDEQQQTEDTRAYTQSKVLSVYNSVLNRSNQPIRVALRSNVDTTLFERTTQISKKGYALPLTFSWETMNTDSFEEGEIYLDFFQYESVDTEFKLVSIYTTQPWSAEENYQLKISEAIHGYNEYTIPISIIGNLKIESTNIENGILEDMSFLRIRFNNRLLIENQEIKKQIKLTNKTANKVIAINPYISYDTLSIWGDFKPNEIYTFTIPAGLSDAYEQKLNENVTFEFKIKETQIDTLPTLLNIFGHDTSFVQNTGKHRILIESRRLNNIAVEVKKLTVDEYRNFKTQTSSSNGKSIDRWVKTFDNFDTDPNIRNSRLEFQYEFNNKADGIYLITAHSDNNQYRSNKVIFLSKYIGIVKTSQDLNESLVWIAEAETGKPAENIEISIKCGADGKTQTANTNSDGIVIFKEITSNNNLYVFSPNSEIYFEAGGSFELNTSQYSYNYYQNDNEDKIYAYFDKPVYRPGNNFSYKVFSRTIGGNELIPAKEPVSIEIRDTKDSPIYTNTLNLNDYGTGHDEFKLSENLMSGEYSIYANGTFLNTFRIEDYEIFNFTFQLDTPPNKLYQPNDLVPVTITGNYYFGEPLANSKVEANLFVRDLNLWEMWSFMSEEYSQFDFATNDYYDWYSSTYSSRKIGSAKFQTDDRGIAKANVPLNIPSDLRNENFKLLSIEVRVEDPLGESEYTSAYAYVVPDTDLYATKQSEYTIRQEQNITMEALHLNSFFKPKAESTIKFVYKRVEETEVRRKNLGGVYSWIKQREYIEEYTDITHTNQKGIAQSIYYPKILGNYMVEIYKGEEEKPFRTNHFTYTTKETAEYYYDYDSYYYRSRNEVILQTDKDSYAVGDNVKITPVLKSSNYIALETIEKKGILSYRIIDLRKTPKIESKVPENSHPNYYYSLFLFQPRNIGSGYLNYQYGITNISVSEEDKKLDVKIITDKEKYKPQEDVILNLEVRHEKNLITEESEVLVAVVDKAVLDVSKIKHNANIEDNMIETFWTNWLHGVKTSTNLTLYENKIIDEIEWGNKGGDMAIGGDGGPTRRPLEIEDVRKDFKEVALWLPIEYTENGKLSTKFKVPDNLTTWEIVAIVITKDTKVGANTKEIKVSKDINIVSGIPRQLINKDEIDVVYDVRFDEEFKSTITNGLVDIQLEVEGFSIECEKGVFSDFCLRTIAITNFPQQFRIITQQEGEQKLRFAVFKDEKTLDAEQIQVTVLPDTHTDEYIKLGVLDNNEKIDYNFPSKTIEDSKFIELTFTEKPFGEMSYFENFFINYSHYCCEQVSSKILSLLAYTENESAKRAVVEGIAHLYTLQNIDGGWGIWNNNSSLTYNSAYALYALTQAQKFGFDVDSKVVERGKKFITSHTKELDDLLYIKNENLFVQSILASQEIFFIDRLNNIYSNKKISEFSNIDKVYLLEIYLAYKESLPAFRVFERNFIGNRIERIKSELYGSLANKNNYSYWVDDQNTNYYYYNNNTKTTAMAFDVLLRIDSKDSRLENVMSYLRRQMETRNTLDTNTNYYLMKAFSNANKVYQMNLKKIQPQITINKKTLDYKYDPNQKFIRMPIEIEAEDINVEISNNGKGNAYFELKIISQRKLEDVKFVQNGFSIYSETSLKNDTIEKGDVLDQTLYLFVDEKLEQLAIHNPIPSGMQIVNFNLAKMSSSLEEEYSEQNMKNNLYFPNKSIRDEGLLIYSSDSLYGYELRRGIYTISFPVRAAYSGKFQVLGEHAQELYSPSRSVDNVVKVIEITY